MRVGLVSYNARAGDAIGNQLAEKVAFFLDRGAEVRVFLQRGECLHPSVAPYALLVTTPEAERATANYLARADVVSFEYGHYYRMLEWLPWLSGKGPRLLLDYHGITPLDCWPGHNREILEKGACNRGLAWAADRVVVHSQFTRRELCRPIGLPGERCTMLGPALDLDHFRPGPPRRCWRAELGLPEEARLLLFVGRLAPNKGLPVLVQALARLRERSPAVHALVLGDTTDLYRLEADRCRDLAARLGVADRLHLAGHVADDRLLDAYRAADVFVMPSRHEGFCLPVVEALACGLPVIAARAGALPETVSNAGLVFEPDDAGDLARQLGRLLDSRPTRQQSSATTDRRPFRLALVCFRFGKECLGGAEASLRNLAHCLQAAGHAVEVYTTCNVGEHAWANHRPAGTTVEDGLTIHRFPIDPHDRAAHRDSFQRILHADGPVPEAVEQAYLTYSIHSEALLAALRHRVADLDAIVVGPYLFGLTHDVATAWPAKTLLLPCFHDEPLARLQVWRRAYAEVGGILYHSPEEQHFAEAELGLAHPGATCIGAWLDARPGNAARGRQLASPDRPYVLYCGRYSRHKNLPLLLEYARRYAAECPGRVRFVFVGGGEVTVPSEEWACDLGPVPAAVRDDLLAGAAALVQLSCYESLSLVALEAWAQGTPVIAHRDCAVLRGQLERSGGGRAVGGYEEFAATLNDLTQRPDHWRQLGQSGQDYVRAYYADRQAFTATLEAAIQELDEPLRDRLRRRGLARAACFHRDRWRQQFGRLLEQLLDEPPPPRQEALVLEPLCPQRTVSCRATRLGVPVRLTNRGTTVVAAEGPGRHVLRYQLMPETPPSGPVAEVDVPLPGLLVPGQALPTVVPLTVPTVPGDYRVCMWAQRCDAEVRSGAAEFRLTVVPEEVAADAGPWGPVLEAVQQALAEAADRRQLPDDYTDVTEGRLARWKRALKRKLLNNFKVAYVDVLSRQQSAFNRQLLTAAQHLAECFTLLGSEVSRQLASLQEQLAIEKHRAAALEERLARYEAGHGRAESADEQRDAAVSKPHWPA